MTPTNIPGPPHLPTPHPDASYTEIRAFLIRYFIQLHGITHDESLQLARKQPLNGKTLYKMSESKCDAIHGFGGRVLYHELQHSSYGLYRNFWGYYGPGGLVPLGFICSLMVLLTLLLDGWRHWRRLPCQVHEDMCLAILAGTFIDGLLLIVWLSSLLLKTGAVRNERWPHWARFRTWGPPKFLEGCWFCGAAVLLVPSIWALYWSLRHF